MSDLPRADILEMTATIVTAHLENNHVGTDGLPELIQSVYRALADAGAPEPAPAPPQEPAVPIRKSVFPDYIVCLEDGKKLKLLKRHLKTSYNTSPADYRKKWHLPSDYPMVAPNYSSRRSSLAKGSGLGRKPKTASAEPEVTKVPARRARGSKG